MPGGASDTIPLDPAGPPMGAAVPDGEIVLDGEVVVVDEAMPDDEIMGVVTEGDGEGAVTEGDGEGAVTEGDGETLEVLTAWDGADVCPMTATTRLRR